jgi:hypothetical protein
MERSSACVGSGICRCRSGNHPRGRGGSSLIGIPIPQAVAAKSSLAEYDPINRSAPIRRVVMAWRGASSRSAAIHKGPMRKPNALGAASKPNRIVQSPNLKSATIAHDPETRSLAPSATAWGLPAASVTRADAGCRMGNYGLFRRSSSSVSHTSPEARRIRPASASVTSSRARRTTVWATATVAARVAGPTRRFAS